MSQVFTQVRGTATTSVKDFMKKLRIYILAFITVFTLSLVGFNVYADEIPVDISTSINASNNNNVYLCGDPNNSNSPSCSVYSYLTISVTGADPDVQGTYTARLKYNNGDVFYGISSRNTVIRVVLPGSVQYIYTNNWSSYFSSLPNAVVTFTLSASDGCTCPSCPVCDDCTFPPFIQAIIDVFWDYHRAFSGAVAGIIVIFLVYRLIKSRVR